MARILHVGGNPGLLATRAAVLRKYWSITSVYFDRAVEELQKSDYDLVVICYTVPDEVIAEIEQFAENESSAAVLTLTPDSEADEVVRRGLGLTGAQDNLISAVESLLKAS